ncbi:MAG: hypothetical protein Q8R67_05235 [Rhodoferax sp.]|nr:hypothetical protein [Rhodoferax sp.]MDP3651070.1 hypothetical protein [Rhodoferax sp.]
MSALFFDSRSWLAALVITFLLGSVGLYLDGFGPDDIATEATIAADLADAAQAAQGGAQ